MFTPYTCLSAGYKCTDAGAQHACKNPPSYGSEIQIPLSVPFAADFFIAIFAILYNSVQFAPPE